MKMKIYDISQEVFTCNVYEGDPSPEKKIISSMDKGDLYNLTYFSMCAHNGTHVDAPYHFIKEGKSIDLMPLEAFVGMCYVGEYNGVLDEKNAINILNKAKSYGKDAYKRILIKGDVVVSLEASKVFASANILLLGNESQTVGPLDSPMEVHKTLLGCNIVLLEGICLSNVNEGVYLLNAAPLNLKDADGSPCRAILIDLNS